MSGHLLFKAMLCLVFCAVLQQAKAQPGAAFTATPLTGCAPLVVNFQDQSTNAVEWRWDLGNSTVSFLQNPSATYFLPGSYTVRLIVKNAAGVADTLTKTNYVTVNQRPQIAFSSNVQMGCYPLNVQFTDNTTAGGPITNWNWDLGDGNSSTAQNPNHTYTTSGSYNVSLMATNSFGCSATLTRQNYINTTTGVTAGFTYSAPAGCNAPQTINFTNTSTGTGTLTYNWNFGDGGTSTLTNPSHIYTASGSFSVTLIVFNSTGCTDTIQLANIVSLGTNQSGFTSPATACAQAPVTFTNTSTPNPTSSFWNFGDGTTGTGPAPVKAYAAAGTYTIKLIDQFGACSDSAFRTITIFPKPTAGFTGAPLVACQPNLTVNFNNIATGAQSVLWLFGDGNTSTQNAPAHTYTSYGNFTVTQIVTNSNGCMDTTVLTDYVKIQRPQITINSLPQQGCAPFAWSFSATVSSLTPIVSYLWNFGDGTTSTSATPSHVFGVGVFDIQLIVQTQGGCADTVLVPAGIRASQRPIAAFDATPRAACANMTISFTPAGSVGNINSWLWYFGDGTTSTDSMPTHQYSDTGYFNIMLIVGANGCFDTLNINQFIHIKPPIAAFAVGIDCINKYSKQFIDQSVGADQWYWNFGDGGTSTQQNPTHVYSATGTYTVSLRVVNNETGCDYTRTLSIIIADEKAQFTAIPTQLCRGTSTTFTATSIQAVPLIASYDWNFGDGSTGGGQTVSHVYTNSGVFDVQLIITDVNGCADTLLRTQYITVFGPVADFVPSVPTTCVSTAISFNDLTVTDGVHPINNWTWNYGDGVIVNNAVAPFTHQYSNAGIYSVMLSVTDTYGCRDSINKINLITISVPEAIFSTADTVSCPAASIQFTNNSTGPNLAYMWNFGDGTSSTLAQPAHSYTSDGLYTVSLFITDQYGCTSMEVKNNYIRIATPVANFSVNDSVGTCPPLIVQFTNTSANMVSKVWDFGDGTTSLADNPTHFYNTPGTYIAKVTITSAGGCTSVKTKTIKISGPQGTFTYAPLEGCSPLQVNFRATSQARSSFVWDFSDGTTIATTDSVISHTYTIPGIYVPKMILKDLNGCSVAITGLDTIKVNGVLAGFSADTLLGCDNRTIQFTNESLSNQLITAYEWDFGDGQTSTAVNPAHYYAAPGLYYPKLKAISSSGCQDIYSAPVPVKIVLSPKISATQSANGCAPLVMNFNGNLINADTSQINWAWTYSNGTTGTGMVSPALTFTNAGVYNYTLLATNSSGCTDAVTGSFEVYGIPVVSAGPDFFVCQNSGRSLTATGASSYTWSPAIGLSCANCASPTATPDSVRTYVVTGTTLQGCRSTDTVTVSVVYPFYMSASSGDTLCVGRSTGLLAGGAATYSWSPSAGLNVTSGPSVIAKPIVTTLYRVIGQDGKNCFSDTAYYPIQVYPIPTVKLRADTTMNVGSTIILTPQVSPDVTNVVWQNPIGLVQSNYPSITVRPTGQTQYNVTVSNAGGCTSRSSMNIFVTCNGSNVFIPNTFSPNADGANDVFYVRGTGLFNVKQLKIFNRWGEQVFSRTSVNANDPSAGWDGTYKGQRLGDDVYVYMIEVQCENNTSLFYKGNVTLIK